MDIFPDEAFPVIRQATKLGSSMSAHFYVLESHLREEQAPKDEIDYQ
jgi:hypothetical protein